MNTLDTEIIKSLYFSRSQSIAELSETTGKSIPLITKSIRELVHKQAITKDGQRASTGGRRAMNYELNEENFGYILSIAIDQHYISASIFNIHNNQISPIKTIPAKLNDDETFLRIKDLIQEVISETPKNRFLAIGITVPGFVDSETFVNNSFPESSPMYTLRENIETAFGIQTYIENDSSAIAIAEKKFGKAKDSNNALVINLNWGVGLGIVINDQLFRGNSGFAGEFSHIPLANENKLCSCGKKGCLEVEASLAFVLDYVTTALEQGERSVLESIYKDNKRIFFSDLLKSYEKGDQLSIQAIKKMAYMLGKGIATLIHIMNPERIIISGRGAIFGNILLPEIQSSIQEFCIPRLSQNTLIQISTLENIQLLASASIAVQQLEWNTYQTIN